MSRMMRDAGFVALMLALAASLSWFFSKIRKEGVENYLALLGNQLFATVPDGAEKEELKKKYDQFLTEVADRKIPPEQVEKVAASIFNASNAGEALTAEQVEAVLTLAALPPGEIENELHDVQVQPPKVPGVPEVAGLDSMPRPPKTRVRVLSSGATTPEAWKSLNERIKSLYEFNYKLQGELATPEAPRFHMEYRIEPGMTMQLVVDDSLKREIMQRKDAAFARHWQRLEQEKLVVAQHNFKMRLRGEQERLRQELQRLHELKKFEHFAPGTSSPAMQALEVLRELPTIASVLPVDTLIIRQQIARALRHAALTDSIAAREDIKRALQEASRALREAEARQPDKND